MSRLVIMIVVVSLAGVTMAIAQNNALGPGGGQSGNMSGKMTRPSAADVPRAPVGHRQPTKADVSTVETDNGGLLGPDASEKELDRKIKSICRGC